MNMLPEPIPPNIMKQIVIIYGLGQMLPYIEVTSIREKILELKASRGLSEVEVLTYFADISIAIENMEPMPYLIDGLNQIRESCLQYTKINTCA